MRHLLSAEDLSKEEVEEILSLARSFREGKSLSLRGSVALFFAEPSTRTRLSFEKAAKELGLETQLIGYGESSSVKGESFEDTLRTLEALGFSAVVFRVPFVFFPYPPYLKELKLSLINGGDGTHQHPSQGLTDLLTLLDAFGELKGVKVLFVGDVKHSRVFRSDAYLLKLFGAKVGVCGPAPLIPREVEADEVFYDLDEALPWADAVVWLRLQRERQKENAVPSLSSYFKQFGLTPERYEKVKLFLHPGPVNRNVDVAEELVYGEKSLVLKQVENGLLVRKAVYAFLLKNSPEGAS